MARRLGRGRNRLKLSAVVSRQMQRTMYHDTGYPTAKSVDVLQARAGRERGEERRGEGGKGGGVIATVMITVMITMMIMIKIKSQRSDNNQKI